MNKLDILDDYFVGIDSPYQMNETRRVCEVGSSQQFATVVFERCEDQDECLITVVHNGLVNQFKGGNLYNPSPRRISTCVYIQDEETSTIVKTYVAQHKGITMVGFQNVTDEEFCYIFRNTTLE